MSHHGLEIGISGCLLGMCVRYDGSSCMRRDIIQGIGSMARLVPFCPEHECGMPVPREPMDLFRVSGVTRLMTVGTGRDLTGQLMDWVENRLSECRVSGLGGFILKSGSPSCGLGSARLHESGALKRNGTGLFASSLAERFPDMPLAEDTGLVTQADLSTFLERIADAQG
ncbi:MAG TPA: DUF523 domain-containing protein [Candidatus Sabulitectum sp.]|nr:DUF523 domain-containing protein [Candidatus Sabulitectum sp.]